MEKIEIEKVYIKKINELKKCNEAYFKDDKPIVSDKDYDDVDDVDDDETTVDNAGIYNDIDESIIKHTSFNVGAVPGNGHQEV